MRLALAPVAGRTLCRLPVHPQRASARGRARVAARVDADFPAPSADDGCAAHGAAGELAPVPGCCSFACSDGTISGQGLAPPRRRGRRRRQRWQRVGRQLDQPLAPVSPAPLSSPCGRTSRVRRGASVRRPPPLQHDGRTCASVLQGGRAARHSQRPEGCRCAEAPLDFAVQVIQWQLSASLDGARPRECQETGREHARELDAAHTHGAWGRGLGIGAAT